MDMTDLKEIDINEHKETRKQFQSKLGKKRGIMLASWNIRRKNDSTHNSKWPRIARIMRLKKIAILAIQEARTTEEDIAQIEAVVPKIKIITYALNGEENKIKFFEKLASMTRNNKHKDLCVMGDFKCVENDIDRTPPHKDNEKTVASLRKITTRNKLINVWRMQNPTGKSFPFLQTSSKAMACIDRIYVHVTSCNTLVTYTDKNSKPMLTRTNLRHSNSDLRLFNLRSSAFKLQTT